MERKDEGLKQLGQNTKYSMDYAPEVLESFVNKQLLDSLILPRFASATFLMLEWWSQRV